MQKGGHSPPFFRIHNWNCCTDLVPVTLTATHGFGVYGAPGATAGFVCNRNQGNAIIFLYIDTVIVGRQLLGDQSTDRRVGVWV